MIKIAKYKDTRHWAVWMKDELVAVVCYKKGAKAIKTLLSEGLAGTLNQRIAKTVNKLGNPPR